MDRIIRQITEHFVSQLPEDETYFRLEELKKYNFPGFLVQRIHIELQWNLDESMILPNTDWANTESDAVQESWQRFLNAIHAEVQLPASYAKAVIETAVTDIVDMLVQPRKNITDILFGGEDTLSAAEVDERTELLVVYPHFARVLTGYMQRKNRKELSRERCKEIIRQVDTKVTDQYTPLQWAQMLDPLFTIAGPEIESDLLRLFFEDRTMRRTARRFDMMNKSITRAEFIEVLSSPEMLNYDGYEDDQSDLFPEEEEEQQQQEQQEPESSESAKPEPDEHRDSAVAEQQDTVLEEDGESGSSEDTEEPWSAHVEPDEESETEGEDTQLKPEQPNAEAIEPEPEFKVKGREDQAQSSYSPDKEEAEAYDEEMNQESSSLHDIYTQEDEEDDESSAASTSDSEAVATEEAEDEDSPIWMRFMEGEEEDTEDESPVHTEAASNEEPADTYLDEPVIDLTNSPEEEKKALQELLANDEDYFVDELFDGSDRAYREALGEISRKDTWKEASRLIEQNIFKRNMINIYSEAAVDFTDRLHDYFIEKENQT